MKHHLSLLSIILFIFFSPHLIRAQWKDNLWIGKQADNWIFYGNNGLNFNTEPPSQIAGAVTAPYDDAALGCGTISDSSGSLLFSTSSDRVYNSNFQQMTGGEGLISHFANVQEGLIIPRPNSSIYYVFHMHRFNNAFYEEVTDQGALFYSVVDMEMNDGFGAVTDKNILLDSLMSPKITAVHHADRERIWVVGHGMMDFLDESSSSNEFYAYLISENGISSPVVSAVGPFLSNADQGQMKISPDGKKIAFVSGTLFYPEGIQLAVFDFDNQSGIITNPVILTGTINGLIAEGLEFSPNSRYLYVSEYGFAYDFARLHQFDLQAGDQDAILASRVLLAEEAPAATFAHLQLAPNGKIYMANPTTYYAFNDPAATSHLSIIHNPNNAGAAANFEHLGYALQNDCSFGLPGFIQSYFESGILHEGQCVGEAVSFETVRIPEIETVTWDFGDPESGSENFVTTPDGNTAHIFSSPGTYTVRAEITSNGALQVATTEIEIIAAVAAVQPQDILSCDMGNGDALFNLNQQDTTILGNLNPLNHNLTYHTSLSDALMGNDPISDTAGYTSPNRTVYVRLTNEAGCFDTTQFNLIVAPLPDFSENLTLTGCPPLNLTKVSSELEPDSDFNFYYSQSDAEDGLNPIINTSRFELSGQEQTIYLRVETDNGCTAITSLLLLAEDCVLPRGISPNGDGLNDYFDLSFLEVHSLEIFNRYGQSVYKAESYSKEWQGQTDKGKELPTGTYYYVITLEQEAILNNKQVHTGWVYINR